MSERTFRRRLKRAQAHLARLLGAADQEPDTHRGLEIGLAAWAGLGGGPVVASGAAGHLVAALESARVGAVRLLGRLRGPGTRLAASEAPERIGAIAGGPAGKVVGGCAGAAVVCVLSGVVGPGLELGGVPHTSNTAPRHHVAAAPTSSHPIHQIIVNPPPTGSRVKAPEPTETHATSPSPTEPEPRHRRVNAEPPKPKKVEEAPPANEAEQAEEQFSGVAQAAAEAEGETSTSSEAAPLQSTSSTPPGTAGQSSHESTAEEHRAEERQAEEQFEGPLAR